MANTAISEHSPLRVLHLIDHSVPLFSGYSFRSRYIALMQKRLGFEVEVVTSARHGAFEAMEETFDGVRYHRTRTPAAWYDRVQLKLPFWRERLMTGALARRAASVAASFRPDVLHAHSPFFDGQAALRVGRRLGVPVVYEIRAFWEDDAVDKGKFREGSFVYRQVRRLETDVAMSADHVVCICEGLRNDVIARGVPAAKVSVVKNGAEPGVFAPRPKDAALARRYGLGDARVLGFIGSFFHYEGLPELVRATARAVASGAEFQLLLVGGGEDDAPVRELVRSLGLESHVILAGRVEHARIADHYALCDGLIYPRRSKRLTELVTPLKPLEAMSMERVCLGSDVGGIRELFEECGVGTLFKADDPQALDGAIRAFLGRSTGDLDAEGRRGRAAVMERRTWEQCVEPIRVVYENLCGRRVGAVST